MISPQKYSTAKAFRVALEARLKQIANNEHIDLQRLRRLVAFDRLLARIFQSQEKRWVLKGGYAMELRMEEARTTKDIDLVIEGPKQTPRSDELLNDTLLEELREQASKDLGDYFVFMVGLSIMDIDAAPYGGARYPVDARMDGRTFVKFHLDIGVGDAVMEPLESTQTRDWLGFAGIDPPIIELLSKEQQFAEKLHAYTLPGRIRPNSRVKDLIDIVLLLQRGGLKRKRIKESLDVVFSRRKTHNLPNNINPPPANWRLIFEKMAGDCNVNIDIDEAFKFLEDFYKNFKKV
jgi:hypothetical protein